MKTFTNICFLFGVFFISMLFPAGCSRVNKNELSEEKLYSLFKDPPSQYRPFVRWWWNGNCIEVGELQRELDVMKEAGIGGVEINPIAHPGGGNEMEYQCYDWLSPEWNERVKKTISMADDRNMIVDIIMGSGWPFGGEFLTEDQFIQGVGIKMMELQGPEKIRFKVEDEWQTPGTGNTENPYTPGTEVFFLQMLPHGAKGITELVDLMSEIDDQGYVEIEVPKGKHDLYIGTFQKAFRTVVHGAPGSSGPVVNHYSEEDVRAYMDKFANVLGSVLGGELGDHIRALFCDSIEMSGSNFTDDLFEEFEKRRGYDLKPYVSLVYYAPYKGYADTLHYDPEFIEDIRRIRYDFNKTLVELFLERFTTTFDAWANEHGMKSRYQAYGLPWLAGILDGYRLVDIPESNNWLYSIYDDPKQHGYWIWNKYCSSAAHLSGARVISSEAMTNTGGVFRLTLDMIKQADDFNFISGINHSVLHGFNYSPPEAGFPGWIRYGAYFSDQNSWWPYFKHWTDYNSRLSAVFQNAEAVTDIAIMTPEADIWKQAGLVRGPFYNTPWYNHDLWEGFSRNGITADYINEGVLQRARAENGKIISENAEYQMVIVSGAFSVEPATAKAIHQLAKEGVKFLFVDRLPSEAPSYHEKEINDRKVKDYMDEIRVLDNVNLISAPEGQDQITNWTSTIAGDYGISSNISLNPVNENIYAVKYKFGDSDILFFANQDERENHDFTVRFNRNGKTAWRWDPETGKKCIYPAADHGEINVDLKPLESLLIVLSEKAEGEKSKIVYPDEKSIINIGNDWRLIFKPVNGNQFEITTNDLFNFPLSDDVNIATFAGKVTYETAFVLDDTDWDFIDLGIEKHISEVIINGRNLGTKWWGRHIYPVEKGIFQKGSNKLEIIYTTTLANYANSLEDNKNAKRWINLKTPDPMGLDTDVNLIRKKSNSPSSAPGS